MIAALSGYTVGAGLELALLCDLRIVEESAVIGMFNRRFGVPTLSGGTVRLPALIGYSRAMDMILTGRGITAEEAFAWGLVNRIAACGTCKRRNNFFEGYRRFGITIFSFFHSPWSGYKPGAMPSKVSPA